MYFFHAFFYLSSFFRLHQPVAHSHRASSIVVSGTNIIRPYGQIGPVGQGLSPTFEPSKCFDFELELAFYIGQSM